ncbi:MAG: TetR/AcrR family transcriptional regulator [Deltaproteobacteria bacterium]|nr:TetR/AcrR family transcriptional regulator [Deltaproteobacteria bacterium]
MPSKKKIDWFGSSTLAEWAQLPRHILELEAQGVVTRTFRRLDPVVQRRVVGGILEESKAAGPTGVTLRGVAARAKVSVGSLYSYFGSREMLIRFAVELCARYLVDLMAMAGPYMRGMPLRDGLRLYLATGLEMMEGAVPMMEFFGRAAYAGDAGLQEPVVRPVADAMRGALQAMLEGARDRGELRAGLDLDATVRVVNTLLPVAADSQLLPHLNAYLQTTGGDVDRPRMVEALIQLVAHGIAAEAGAAGSGRKGGSAS